MNAKAKRNANKSQHTSAGDLDRQLPGQVIPFPIHAWPEAGYKALPHAISGALLGSIAGCTSLLANIIGGLLWSASRGIELSPFRIIQVYLTFPLGESALQLNSGLQLGLGCLLYLFTGMLYGMLFELVISYFLPRASQAVRLTVFSGLAIVVWVINFYGILIWLQPLLFHGRWIFDLIPWWVAAATHLVFGVTLALLTTSNSYPPSRRTAKDETNGMP